MDSVFYICGGRVSPLFAVTIAVISDKMLIYNINTILILLLLTLNDCHCQAAAVQLTSKKIHGFSTRIRGGVGFE
jgi:hypothetical protein